MGGVNITGGELFLEGFSLLSTMILPRPAPDAARGICMGSPPGFIGKTLFVGTDIMGAGGGTTPGAAIGFATPAAAAAAAWAAAF